MVGPGQSGRERDGGGTGQKAPPPGQAAWDEPRGTRQDGAPPSPQHPVGKPDRLPNNALEFERIEDRESSNEQNEG